MMYAFILRNRIFSVDLRTIGISDSPIIVDRSPPVAGKVNDGEIYKVDLQYTMYPDKVCNAGVLLHDYQLVPDQVVNIYSWINMTTETFTDLQ
jgi:hypothetical protein